MFYRVLIAACLLHGVTGQLATAQMGPASVASKGLETPWDVRTIVTNLQQDTEQVQPLLAEMNPQAWVDSKGAPSTYIAQWQSAQQQLKDLNTMLRMLSQKTESLPTGLDVYFRLEALETVERSCEQGARQYDVRANADKLATLIAHNFDNRQRLRDYLKNLATSTEENFRIADQEAQRCRTTISKQVPAGSTKKR